MNQDYAHVLPGGRLNHLALGIALRHEMRLRRHSFRKAGRVIGVDDHTVKTVAGGGTCSFATGMKICIYLDLNPFELFVPVSREIAGSAVLSDEAEHG